MECRPPREWYCHSRGSFVRVARRHRERLREDLRAVHESDATYAGAPGPGARRLSTARTTRPAANSGSSCSQMRTTVQPAASEPLVGVPVSADVGGELLDPPLAVRLRGRGVVRAGVPEAAVDVDRNLGLGEHQVGTAPHPRERRDVDSIAETSSPHRSANGQLGLGVASRLALHPPTDVLRRRRRAPGASVRRRRAPPPCTPRARRRRRGSRRRSSGCPARRGRGSRRRPAPTAAAASSRSTRSERWRYGLRVGHIDTSTAQALPVGAEAGEWPAVAASEFVSVGDRVTGVDEPTPDPVGHADGHGVADELPAGALAVRHLGRQARSIRPGSPASARPRRSSA